MRPLIAALVVVVAFSSCRKAEEKIEHPCKNFNDKPQIIGYQTPHYALGENGDTVTQYFVTDTFFGHSISAKVEGPYYKHTWIVGVEDEIREGKELLVTFAEKDI